MRVVVISSVSLPLSETTRALHPSTRPTCRSPSPPGIARSQAVELWLRGLRGGGRHRGLRRGTRGQARCAGS